MGTSRKVKQVTEKDGKTNPQRKTTAVGKDDGNENQKPLVSEEGSLGPGLDDKQIEQSPAQVTASEQKPKGHRVVGEDPVNKSSENEQVIREREQEFRVYLDSNLRLRWEISKSNELSEPCKSTITQAQLISAIPATYLDKAQKKAWMRILGESIALALTEDTKNAKKAIGAAKSFISSRANEKAKVWYVQASFIFSFCLAVVGLIHFFVSDAKNFSVLMAIVFGVTGAQFSILLRLATLDVDPSAGKVAHYTEAVVRILIGALAGIITFAAVKSGLVFNFLKYADFWSLALVSILAGVSERFVPSFLRKMENSSLEAER